MLARRAVMGYGWGMTKDPHVLEFTGITRLDLPVGKILKAAREAKLQAALVIGFDKDGDFYFASSKADGGEVLWLLELAKKRLLEVEL